MGNSDGGNGLGFDEKMGLEKLTRQLIIKPLHQNSNFSLNLLSLSTSLSSS